MDIFQRSGNVEEVRIKLNSGVSSGRINGRRSLIKTNGMLSKPVICPIDAATQKN
jgi:hypothetical protein